MAKDTAAKKAAAEKAKKERQAKLDKMNDAQKAAFIKQERSDNFAKLATARTNKLLAAIENLGKLSSRNYVYTQAQVDQIKGALGAALNTAMAKFNTDPAAVKTSAGFKLS